MPHKPFRTMTHAQAANRMRAVGRAVKAELPEGELFCVIVFGPEGLGQYIANAVRGDVVKGIRECADRLERRETFERENFPDRD